MSKKRVYEVARELDMKSKDYMDVAEKAGVTFSSHMSSITDQEIEQISKKLNNKQAEKTGQSDNNQQQSRNQQKNKQGDNKESKQESQKSPQNKNQSDNKNQSNTQNKQQSNNKKSTTPPKQNKNKKNRGHRGNRKAQGTHGGVKGTGQAKSAPKKKQASKQPAKPQVLEYTEGMSIADIANEIGQSPAELVQKLFMMGVMANQNQSLDKETIEILADELGIEAEEKVVVDSADFSTYLNQEVDEDALVNRPPVVTIMGHVDHGKTTLLDTLRHASVAQGEAGGITQHIGAYQIDMEGDKITFLDTPGHAAFTTMRSRGADITDIVIIVVAADDGVKPQTIEAISHAKAAGVPIIVAINKVDKPSANPDRVKQELMEYELIPEDWGGDTIFVEISALMDVNIDELLEMVSLIAEVEELKADPTARPIGSVVEARLDKSRGPVSTILVQEGILKIGAPIVVGSTHGRVRTMVNDKGQDIEEAGPSQPVEITGLTDTPEPGDHLIAFKDEKTARQIGEERASRQLDEDRKSKNVVSLENLFDQIQESELKAVDVVLKADVRGSVEALASSLNKIEVEDVRVNIIHTGVGAINESDVSLATASNALIIGFNVRPNALATDAASNEGVSIRTYNVIYEAIDDVENAMKGLLDPEFEEQVTGNLTVRETYSVTKVGTIAGCYVNQGVIKRSSSVRVIRDGIVVYEGDLASLRRFEDDVKEVTNGYECGLMLENFNDIIVDDQIEAFEMVEIEK